MSGDGCGIDIDGRNENIVFRRNLVHDNAGPGVLILSTGIMNDAGGIRRPLTPNRNITIEDNVFWNNGLSPNNLPADFGGDGWEIKLANTAASGSVRNNRFIIPPTSFGWISADTTRQNRFGAMSGFTLTGNEYLWGTPGTDMPPSAASPAPLHSAAANFWFAGRADGVLLVGAWGSQEVSRSFLRGDSAGDGAALETFGLRGAPGHALVRLRFYATAGGKARLYWKTGEGEGYSVDRSLPFTYARSGTDRFYVDPKARPFNNGEQKDYDRFEEVALELAASPAWTPGASIAGLRIVWEDLGAGADFGLDWLVIGER
jgi:hypothetical protein